MQIKERNERVEKALAYLHEYCDTRHGCWADSWHDKHGCDCSTAYEYHKVSQEDVTEMLNLALGGL